MTVLVTGGAGYIGSHLVRALIKAGRSVVVIDDLRSGFAGLLPENTPLFVCDAGDASRVDGIVSGHRVSAIVHLAGSISPAASIHDPLGYYRNNTISTQNLLDVAWRRGVRHFIFSSTAAVYGNAQRVPTSEDEPSQPLSPYARSKLMGELILRDVAAIHDMNYVALRYFNVAGADPQARTGLTSRDAQHLLKVATEAATGHRDGIDVFGSDYPTPDGTCIRDFIHVADVADAHCATLAYLEGGGASATWNCGYGRGYSVLDVIAAVHRISGRKFAVRYRPRRSGDPTTSIADTTRMRNAIGWRPRFDELDVIVRHALAWEKKLMSDEDLRARLRLPVQPRP
jgi:UDP-glucose 4-epimerase